MLPISSANFAFDSLDSHNSEAIKKCFNHFVASGDNGLDFKAFASLLESLFVNKRKIPYYIPMQWKTELFRLFDSNGDKIISFDEFESLWKTWIQNILHPRSALVIVDVQNDFVSGSLAINKCPAGHNGEEVVPMINQLIGSVPFDLIVYSLDWHPSDHISFYENLNTRKYRLANDLAAKECDSGSAREIQLYDTVIFEGPPQTEQKLWPTHCIQNTWGSQLHEKLNVGDNSLLVYKGTQSNIDSYSAFWDNQKLSQTNLRQELDKLNITDVYVCGIAYDVCVGSTALHSTELGFRTVVIDDASKGLCTESINRVKSKLCQNKAIIVNSNKVLDLVKGLDRRPELGYALAFKACHN